MCEMIPVIDLLACSVNSLMLCLFWHSSLTLNDFKIIPPCWLKYKIDYYKSSNVAVLF